MKDTLSQVRQSSMIQESSSRFSIDLNERHPLSITEARKVNAGLVYMYI